MMHEPASILRRVKSRQTWRFAQLALVKPDHVGDFVLALPNIRFLASLAKSVDVFVHPNVLSIARSLLPDMRALPISFSHLSRTGERTTFVSKDFAKYDAVFLLRQDSVLTEEWARSNVRRSFSVGNTQSHTHETFGQAEQIAKIVGVFDVDQYALRQARPFPRLIKRVGLAIGSGFTANIWPWVNWIELYRKLTDRGLEVVFIGGPTEAQVLERFGRLLDFRPEQCIVGSSDIESFMARVEDLDVVIAADGGTGHLCSLATNVLSLQMSGNWRRFSPFGSRHRTITRNLPCAPCINFDPQGINLCASRECSYLLLPNHIVDALFMPQRAPGTVKELSNLPHADLIFGVSHAGRRADHHIQWW
jgi:ADP-heptose:LPS heptosyltransferase